MAKSLVKNTGLGTTAVFFTAISTILGAIMFLRFGYAVGNLGFYGGIIIILVGHAITIPTAMAIAEIATNQKVEGGGEYYIISRSFGLNIGGAIGVALFLSQATSVAFYIIAFAQAFDPLFNFLLEKTGLFFYYPTQTITIPASLLLIYAIIKKGAELGMKMLYFVVAILFLSLIMFFMGTTPYSEGLVEFPLNNHIARPHDFFTVFAICFPGFTGMTAGVGLSGELKNPSRSIPVGTMLATVVGMIVYIAIVYKLAVSAPAEDLASNQLIMSDIALWGPIIPIGLAAATLSSAIGSILVAPRTLQALGTDHIFPLTRFNTFISRKKKGTSEPINALFITAAITISFVLINDVDKVAQIISSFFMITYGALCTISFLEHFSADPAYRPSFRSKWYLSLLGAVGCFFLMFQMNALYAIVGFFFLIMIYYGVTYFNTNRQGMTKIFQEVISQLSRRLQIFLQKVEKDQTNESWRPSVICISKRSFERYGAFDMLRWIAHKYGFGTYIHRIEDYVSKESNQEAKGVLSRLISMADTMNSNIYLDTMISPSFTSALSHAVQLPGISGKDNNMILFEYDRDNKEELKEIVENFPILKSSNFDIALLSSSIRGFGFKRNLHIWIASSDFENANLMILLGYIILGHKDWKNGSIKIFALYPQEELQEQQNKLLELTRSGRIPIAPGNIRLVPKLEDQSSKDIIKKYSQDADLTILGFRYELVKHQAEEVFTGYDEMGDILFMNASTRKKIE